MVTKKEKHMTVKEAKKIIATYNELIQDVPYGYSKYPSDLLVICDKLEALGFEWGDNLSFVDFYIRKGDYHLTNSATHYKLDKDTFYIHWDNGNIGKYQFVSDSGYWHVDDEWNEFKERLMSYEPLDYDPLNCHIIYDIEHGKKLLRDYKGICAEIEKKMQIKVTQAEIDAKRKDIEKLEKKLKESEVKN